MENNTTKYGDLSDEELFEFLDEIESDDEGFEELQSESNKRVELEEDIASLVETPENAEVEAMFDNHAWNVAANNAGIVLHDKKANEKYRTNVSIAVKQRASRLKEDRIRIQREAFRQTNIRLSESISREEIKTLISILVKEHTRMVDKYSEYINRRLTILLNPLIPRRLRLCKSLYPDSIRRSPGFLYKASKEYGNAQMFWAVPDIPYYFPQQSEQDVLKEAKPDFLINIDRAVGLYHEHLNKRKTKELKYASDIVRHNVLTYFDLLRLNPFWFEALYNEIANSHENT